MSETDTKVQETSKRTLSTENIHLPPVGSPNEKSISHRVEIEYPVKAVDFIPQERSLIQCYEEIRDGLYHLPGRFQNIKQLSEGSCGAVYLFNYENQFVAVKIPHSFESFDFNNPDQEALIHYRETLTLLKIKDLQCDYLLKCFGVVTDGVHFCPVLEYCTKGDLLSLCYSNDPFLDDPKNLIVILNQVAYGLSVLHHADLIHGDIALRNIFMTEVGNNFRIKIGDFSFVKRLHENESQVKESHIGPIRWMAPEALLSHLYSPQSDIWSFGVFALELLG